MKTIDDVLSFHDLNIQNAISCFDEAGNLVEEILRNSKSVKGMSDRLIHTFLEWNLYNSYIYKTGWRISYKSEKPTTSSIRTITITRVDTIEEAVLIAIKKVSRLLGKMVHLEAVKMSTVIAHSSPYDGFYKVIDGAGEYCGMVEIEAIG